MRKAFKILRNIVLSIIAILILLLVLINMSFIQTFLAKKASVLLQDKLKTKVEVKNVRIDLLNHVVLEGLYVEDLQNDTLAYIGKLEVWATDWFFLSPQTPVLHYLGLSNTHVHLYRTPQNNRWNYDFIIDAFASDTPPKKKKSSNDFKISLKKIALNKVSVHYNDAWVGSDYDIDIGDFLTNIEEFDMDNKKINISKIDLLSSSILLRDYKGGKPPRVKSKIITIDTTAFNTDNWGVSISKLNFNEIKFRYKSKETAPFPNEFDPELIDVSNISFVVDDIFIKKDTVKGVIKHFTARERSGFEIKEMKSRVTVSPIASICKDLYLETNNSVIGDYYAMHYTRFPDFEDYIDKVKMVGNLKNSKIDLKDVAYFAPPLRQLPISIVNISGAAKGTVADLEVNNFDITDGFSKAKGDIKIKGLPDIDNTMFSWTNGELFTTGNSIFKYAPELKDNKDVNFKVIQYAYFKGDFSGKLQDFNVKGNLTTNVGSINTDLNMKMYSNQKPYYAGKLSSKSFDIGLLLNQSTLGKTTFDATFDGNDFDVSKTNVKANIMFQELELNGYTYRNINTDGVFDKNKFDGKLFLNDSNISLGFYGVVDFSDKDIKIKAKANLLSSNLKALNFVEVPTTLSADFDLDCSGNTIDDFVGIAKLYNINLLRHNQRMDLDSVNIESYKIQDEKHIDISSNLLTGNVLGQYELSKMPNALQYYFSNYLPNYISKPSTFDVNQNVKFNIQTHHIDAFLRAFTLYASGFDNSNFEGSFNTSEQTLKLKALVPYGKVANVKIYNSSLSSEGGFKNIKTNIDIEKFIVGNNLLTTSLKLESNVHSDTIQYKVVTQSDEQIGTATILGSIVAENDNLIAAFQPSEFYLNNAKWEIAANNRIFYNPNKLEVNNLLLTSGLQQIRVNTDIFKENNPLLISLKNIDIAALAGLNKDISAYKLEGRINGDVGVENILSNLKLNTNLEANGVKLLEDSIGLIKLIGSYDVNNSNLKIDSNTGIYNDYFKLLTHGYVYLDTSNRQQLNLKVNLNNLPLKILTPLLDGYASNLDGIINGSLSVGGNIQNPFFDGQWSLKNILARVDYTGSIYSIPSGKINFSKQQILLDSIELFDVYNNKALVTGNVSFKDLVNPRLNLRLKSDELEVVNLKENENELFYGHVIANTDFSVSGSISNMNMSVNAKPIKKSKLFIPYNAAGDHSTSTYITFKKLGAVQEKPLLKQVNKLSIKISAVLNNFLDLALILDPSTGDQITANGNGNLTIDVPANEDYSMFGTYIIDKGGYVFTFRQILSRTFNINSESTITFGGALDNTRLNVRATYPTTTRLYDLLDASKARMLSPKEEEDAKASQPVNVNLFMTGTLTAPELNYEIELQEKRSLGTTAFAELNRINTSDKTALTNQVSALLLLGSFIPSQGISNTMAVTGAKNTMGDMLASQMSPVLTSALNKMLGDKNLQVLLQYKSFGQDALSTQNIGAISSETRNQVKFGVKKNYFDDRLSLQVSSAYDWGRPTSNNQNTSSFNIAGDFRAQYQLTEEGGLSLVAFRTSNYDIYYGNNIARTGVGISYRKSFDNFYEFIHSKKRLAREHKNRIGQVSKY